MKRIFVPIHRTGNHNEWEPVLGCVITPLQLKLNLGYKLFARDDLNGLVHRQNQDPIVELRRELDGSYLPESIVGIVRIEEE